MDRLITLTTDFGWGSPYVAAMKGVILSINPRASIVDISHAVRPQDVRGAALLLAEATTWFPAGTLHVAVVDPGVGTSREIVYAELGDQRYLAPNNGLLSRLSAMARPARVVSIDNAEHWLPAVSNTFHGRDIIAPVAAQLTLGIEPEQFGSESSLEELDWPAPKITESGGKGEVLWIDPFGNLITNIAAANLPTDQAARENVHIEIREKPIQGVVQTYGERPKGTLVALIGSSGMLEVAVVNGNAAARLGATVGQPVKVQW